MSDLVEIQTVSLQQLDLLTVPFFIKLDLRGIRTSKYFYNAFNDALKAQFELEMVRDIRTQFKLHFNASKFFSDPMKLHYDWGLYYWPGRNQMITCWEKRNE